MFYNTLPHLIGGCVFFFFIVQQVLCVDLYLAL